MAIAQAGSALSALFTILFAGVYMAIMFGVVRPLFAMIGATYQTKEVAGKGVVAPLLYSSTYLGLRNGGT